jgi:hypothetical protein
MFSVCCRSRSPPRLPIRSFEPCRHPSLIPKLLRHLLDEVIKAPLAECVRRIAFAFRNGLGPRQPLEDIMGKAPKRARNVALDFRLALIEWIDARRRKGREGCGPHPDYRMRSFNGVSGGR